MEHEHTATREPAEGEILYCPVHPKEATTLRCNRCGRPMCSQCAVRTPVGYRCKECVRGQQKVFYTAKSVDPVIQGVIALAGGALGTFLISLIGFGFFSWLIAFWAGSAAGALVADVAHRAAGKRRGRYSWLIVAGAIVLGGLAALLMTRFTITGVLFLVMAVSGAVGRLRLGRGRL